MSDSPLTSARRRTVETLHEVEGGEGNGIIHWYCSEECRAEETRDHGEVDPITLDGDDCPEGSICETCAVEL